MVLMVEIGNGMTTGSGNSRELSSVDKAVSLLVCGTIGFNDQTWFGIATLETKFNKISRDTTTTSISIW